MAAYPYLGLAAVLLALWAAGLALLPGWRRSILAASLLQAPFGLLSVFFVPDYWNPARIVPWEVGPEDILFSFAGGGLMWMLALAPHRRRVRLAPAPDTLRMLRRYLVWVLPGTTAGIILYRLGLGPMTVTGIVSLTAGAWLARRQRAFAALALTGGAGFGLLYGLLLKAFYLVWPEFAGQWTHANLTGLQLAGLPLEEIFWAAGGGAVWPLFVSHVLEAEITRSPAPPPDRAAPPARPDRARPTPPEAE